MKRLLVCAIILFPYFISAQLDETALQEARSVLKELLINYPGISIAVGYKDEVVWKEGFGFADAANKVMVESDHQFRYYSLSKSLTGIAIAKLMEDGLIDIEHAVTNYVPDLPDHYQQVKVKHLLNHTAGVRHYNKGEWMEISQDHCHCTEEAIQVFINDPLESVPGEFQKYSSFGYVLLSHLITKVSGMSYYEYVDSAIFDPIAIDIAPDQSSVIGSQTRHYLDWKSSKSKGKLAKPVNNTCKFGGGGFVGTAEALAKVHLAMASGNIVSNEYMDRYYTAIPYGNEETPNYAFGISDQISKSGFRYHSHTGSAVGGYGVLAVYEPSDEFPETLVIVILGNRNSDKMVGALSELSKILRSK